MTKMLDLPKALERAGVTVRTLEGWDELNRPGYLWREVDGNPAGHMHHHTATTSYVPNRDKANGWAGLSRDKSVRLYQESYDFSMFEPVYVIANAYPAPVTSGAGDISVLQRVRAGIEVVGRQGPDTPDWYGNTHYWNTEWVLDGVGAPVDKRVWDMMVTVCRVQNELMGWNANHHIAHGHHTRRKVDLRIGQCVDFDETIMALRSEMEDGMPKQQWNQMIDALFAGRPDMFQGNPNYWKELDPESPEWNDFWAAFVRAISQEG